MHSTPIELQDRLLDATAAVDAPIVRIAHARIIREPERFWSVEWLKHQALTLSWANLALAITLIILSAQLTAQQRAMHDQQTRLSDQQAALLSLVSNSTSLLVNLQVQASSLARINATLNFAIDHGLLNFTDYLAQLATIDTPHVVGDPVTGLGTSFDASGGWSADAWPNVPPQFWKDRGMVRLAGVAICAVGATPAALSVLFELPPGYCPDVGATSGYTFLVYANNLHAGFIAVTGPTAATGKCKITWSPLNSSSWPNSAAMLDGIAFPLTPMLMPP